MMQVCEKPFDEKNNNIQHVRSPEHQSVHTVKEKAKPVSRNIEKNELKKQENTPIEKTVAPAGDVEIEKHGIQAYWKEIKDIAKSISPETAALLNSCKTVKTKDGKIILIFSSSILQSKMENGKNMEHARQAVKQYTGRDYDLACEVVGKQGEQSKLDPAINQDGMIGAALSLGGKMSKKE
jgi:hypothetical protein